MCEREAEREEVGEGDPPGTGMPGHANAYPRVPPAYLTSDGALQWPTTLAPCTSSAVHSPTSTSTVT